MALITISGRAGSSLSLPQELSNGSTPSFAGLRLHGFNGLAEFIDGKLVSKDLGEGQILVGTADGATKAHKLVGTDRQISVRTEEGALTLSLPQDLDKNASPIFNEVTVSGAISAAGVGKGIGTTVIKTPDGQLLEMTSSAAHKNNIVPANYIIDPKTILSLNPRSYNYKSQPNLQCFGFVAEEVAEIAPELVLFKDDKPYSIQYMSFVPLIVDVLKEHEETLKKVSLLLAAKEVVAAAEKKEVVVADIVQLEVPKKEKKPLKIKVLASVIVGVILSSFAVIPRALGYLLHR